MPFQKQIKARIAVEIYTLIHVIEHTLLFVTVASRDDADHTGKSTQDIVPLLKYFSSAYMSEHAS